MSTLEISFSTAPYPGLRPFHRFEADIFFGREEQTDHLLRKLRDRRFLAVVGPSGCGKSSLVRAGLIAGLETGYVSDAGTRWRVAEMRPGTRPLRSLAEALARSAGLFPDAEGDGTSAALVEAGLRRGPLGLVESLRGSVVEGGVNLLLLVDQFEEIFRFRREGDADEAEAFASLLLATARHPGISVYVVLTMRSDFLGDCALFPGLPEELNEGMFLTPRMTREQCRKAIEGPARVFGGEVDRALVSRLLNELDPEPDQLPVLQHVLMRLWTRLEGPPGAAAAPAWEGGAADRRVLTVEDYEAVGGLQQALSLHVDEAFDSLDAEGREIARKLFTLLTERGANRRDVRRPVRLGEVVEATGAPLEKVVEVVEAFRRADRSFLTPAAGTELLEETTVDISHESLIRQWRRLSGWVEREAASAAAYRRLKDAAQAWEQGQGNLWRDVGLENARRWKENEKPSPVWARRYGTEEEFALVERFIATSHAEEEALRRKEAAQRLQSLRQAQFVAAVLLVSLVITVLLWVRVEREQEKTAGALARSDSLLAEQRALQDGIVAAKAATDSVLRRYRSALASTGYYEPATDTISRNAYYGGIADSLSPGSRFDQLSARLRATHERSLPYAPSTYLYPWTDLHEDRTLRSVYSGKVIGGDRPYVATEQVVPQLWFALELPMRGDLHNQFTIDQSCNSFRGKTSRLQDFPDFPAPEGAAVGGLLADCGVRRGNDFEPLEGKGAAARATLYFLLRYPGEISQRELPPDRIPLLIRWHREHPVTDHERHRNAAIEQAQGTRNPLVDHPGWADRIDFTRGYRRPASPASPTAD